MTWSRIGSTCRGSLTARRVGVSLLVVGVASLAAPLTAIAMPVALQGPGAQPKANIAPRIRSVSPGYATAGGTAMRVNLHGEGYADGAVARWNGQDRPTRVVSRALIQMELTAADIATARVVPIIVFVPGGTAGVSNGVSFEVRAATADSEAPVITGLAPITRPAADASGAVVTFPLPQATDNSGTAQVTCAPVSGSRFPIGATTVACTARDPSGNTSSVQFVVTVTPPVDREPPRFTTAVSDVSVPGSSTVVSFRTPSATDNAGTPTVTCNPASGSTFATGTTLVTCVARDAAGNTATATFRVTVFTPAPPAPSVQSLQPATVLVGAPVLQVNVTGIGFTTTTVVRWNTQQLTTRFVSASLLEVDVPPSFLAAPGAFEIRVVEGASSSSALTFTVIADTQAPAITAPDAITVPLTAGSAVVVNYPPPRATDNSGTVQVTCTPASGTAFPLGITSVSCTARDPSGNTSRAEFRITVVIPPDVIPPTIRMPADIRVPATSGAGATVRFEPLVTDNQPGMTYTCQPASASVFPPGITSVTCTARDAAGNTASGTFRVTVDISLQDFGSALDALRHTLAPAVTSLSPTWTIGGQTAAGRVVEVNGSGFMPGAVVQWRGVRDLPTTFVSGTRVTASLGVMELNAVGTGNITVRNSASAASAPLSFTVVAPNPQITSLQPSSVTMDGPAFTLQVNGQNFVPGMTALVGTTTVPTRFINHGVVELDVPAQAITAAKVVSFGVLAGQVVARVNYGGTTILDAYATLSLTPPAVVPGVATLYPTHVLAGTTISGPRWLTVGGGNFYPGMRVRWNGRDTETHFATGNVLEAGTVNGADVATPGVARITVFNPTNARESASLPFAVIAARDPRIAAISPAPYPVGRAGILEVRGENFIPGAQIVWNGSPRPTEFVNTTTLRAQILGSDAAPGTGTEAVVGVSVRYGDIVTPAVFVSRALPISGGINPMPVLSQLSPTTLRAGNQSVAIGITVRGSGFVRGSVVRWNGQARPTTYVSPTQLSMILSSSDVAAPGVVAVTVVNPSPGGGLSAPRTIAVQ